MGKDAPSARERAVERLLRIEQDRAFVSRLGGDVTDDDAREERRTSEYLAGVTRQRRRLDFLIEHFYRGDAEALDPVLRQILRVGLYDLLVLRTPPHAAVNESVALAKRLVNPGAGGLVNAILRATQRAASNLPTPDTGNRAEDLAISASFPTWLVERWLEQFGEEETRLLLEASNRRPAYSLRLNTLLAPIEEHYRRLDEMGVGWRRSELLDDFVVVDGLQPILRAGWFDEGRLAVQDEAAGLVVRLLDPQPGETILDLASAPGGKAIHSAIRMQDRGSLLAVDINPRRLRLVERAAAAHGLSIIETRAADIVELAEGDDPPTGERVLLDAPCSGLGVLAKRADLRWRIQQEDLERLNEIQNRLLSAAAGLVRPGGLLVYSTCTIDGRENQSVVERFLETNGEFELESAASHVPDEMVTDRGFYLALPHRHGTDGAFGARLRRGGSLADR